MSGDEVMRAAIAALIIQLEAPFARPLDNEALRAVLSDGEFEDYRFQSDRAGEEQKARYLAAPKAERPDAAERFINNWALHLKSDKSRRARRKTLLKNIAKLSLLLESHDTYLATQWQYLWSEWDKLTPAEQAWFEPPVTLSDRTAHNLPRPLQVAPILAKLPDETHFKVEVQIALLRKLLDD